MPTPVAMPKLGMTMEEGTLVSWEVEVGARVEKGAVLFVIETEKTEAEIEATASGWLHHVWVAPGETVPCGTLLAALTEAPDEAVDLEAFHARNDRPERPRSAAPVAPPPARAPAAEVRAPRRKPIAPAARKRAKELGVDAEQVPGSGPGGRVTREDVEAFAAAREALVEVGDGIRLDVPCEGEGDAVLLLPGFGSDASSFAPQVAALADRYRLFGVNPRGVGLSDAPEYDVYAVAQTACDAARVVEGPVHVVGASLGAAAAIELALRQPDRVRSLTLVTPFLVASGRLLAVTEAWTRVAALADADALARMLLPWLFSSRFLEDEKVRERAARGLAVAARRVPGATLARSAAGLRAWAGTRGPADLAKITAPTLVAWGGEDLLTPDGAAVSAAIPGAQALAVDGAGHGLAIEAADTLGAALGKHLARA